MKKAITIITALCLMLMPAQALAKKKKKDNKKTQQTEQVQQEHKEQPKAFALVDPQKQLSGEWTIKKLRNKNITTSQRAYLNFDVKTSRLYGSNGCNVINGKFTTGSSSITFTDIVTTHNSCPNASTNRGIIKALTETTQLEIVDENGMEMLVLRNKSNHELLRLKRHNFDFINGAWSVTQINDQPISDANMQLVIDTDQLSIHGNTGCNIINGIITIDGDKDHAIQFEDLVSTRKMCRNIANETALLIALEETVSAKAGPNGTVHLVNNKNQVVAQLQPLHINK